MTQEDEKLKLPLSRDLLKKLANIKELELEDVDIDLEELELKLNPRTGSVSPAIFTRLAYEFGIIRNASNRIYHLLGAPQLPQQLRELPQSKSQIMKPTLEKPEKIKPTSLLEAKTGIPHENYPGKIVEVTIGATRSKGGSRGNTVTIGGETVPAFYNFMSEIPYRPVIAFDCFDWPDVPLSKVMKQPFREVLHDTAEWAKLCVDRYDADMINAHLLTIDPLIGDASPKEAVKTVEDVLEAVDVPIAVGGCGDPQKDLEVFTEIAEATAGERILFNSVTLDMDIEKTAKVIKENGHTVIAFTSMDVNKARELNRKLYDYLEKEEIVMDTTTAALGYGLDYAYTVMERSRLAALKGDPELNHPISSGSTNAWAAREAWMKMGPEFAPRELRGPIWETVTAQTLLLAGVDYFMMMHPAAVQSLRNLIDNLIDNKKPEKADWISMKV